MNKQQRQLELLLELLNEREQIEENIKALPVGYISVKQISGHTYYYRQWREGNKIISEYVPEAFLNSVKRKIATRKEQENLLKAVKKEIRSTSNKLLRAGLVTEEEIASLREKAIPFQLTAESDVFYSKRNIDAIKLAEDKIKNGQVAVKTIQELEALEK